MENNTVKICGKIISEFGFSHEAYEKKFYKSFIEVERLSENKDIIPLLISEDILSMKKNFFGEMVMIEGQLRSYSYFDEGKRHLCIFVFAKKISIITEFPIENPKINFVFLNGLISNNPVYRKTVSGREITDFILSVKRSYGRIDYIPCISWFENARFIENLRIGTRLNIIGRIQSREYKKKIVEEKYEIRTAYEVSISSVEVIENEESENKVSDTE